MPLLLLDQMQHLLMLVKLNPLAMDFYLEMTLDPIPLSIAYYYAPPQSLKLALSFLFLSYGL